MTKTLQPDDDDGSKDWNSSFQDQISHVRGHSKLGLTNKSANREVKHCSLSLF